MKNKKKTHTCLESAMNQKALLFLSTSFRITQNFTKRSFLSLKIIGNPMITPDTKDVHFRAVNIVWVGK